MILQERGLTITDVSKPNGVQSVYVNDNKVYDKPLPLVELFIGFGKMYNK